MGAIIDVKRGKIKLKVGEETIEFDMFEMTKQPSMVNSCFRVNAIQGGVEGVIEQQFPKESLEA